MELKVLKPRKALNKAFLKLKPNRNQIEHFKTNLTQLLDRTNNTESEEFHKNLVSDFLKKTYYEPNHFINTKGRNDLVIHNGDKAKSTVGVIIEAKKPTNKNEMLTKDKINVKAFQELVLYYLRERITLKNLEVKHMIATNINEWFIFDAHIFEKYFAHNKVFVKQFNEFENERLAGKSTDFFYKEIAAPFIDNLNQEIEFTYFDIRRYEKPLRNENPKDDTLLIALFKLLSPEHLLKLPFTNDSNSLDKSFYGELLHIIGLSEIKQGSKKLIERNKEGQRNTGSLLENAIIQLDSLDKISRLDKPAHFGDTQQERLFNISLELCITWVNRILFLKLLEAQLLTYHNGDNSFEYLSLDKIPNYDDLNSLFFQVLARKLNDRNDDVKTIFEKVPYLNSSLFDPTDLEHKTIFISNLRDDKTIPIYSSTVLKDDKGKKRTGKLSTLQYLFEFLNAYDFSSEGSEEIQEENKTLINASVLGLIFEKINGYKDGSFFTPGFITMYMCRETIRKAVVQKFNETKNWDCNDIESLYDKIENRQEANDIVNSLKICDPAVGSGHFLVSALNEIIAIKNDLKILQDRAGRRLKEYQVEVVNDELIVTDEDGELFEYKPASPESSRVQQALFHEKQTIIENCLFGVDINTNSVKICRLRLWIELLKSAYYISPSTSSSPEKGSWHEAGETSTSSSPEKGRWPKAGGVHNLPHLKHFRKELRKNLTPAEATLWRMLQQKKLDGRKFRRQHSVGNYILDFYCPAERLAIELDGEVHNNVSAQEYDLERDLFLKHFGIKVLRFENRMVFEQPEMVLEAIRLEFGKHEPPRPQADTPPLKGGELQTLPNIDINIKCGNSLISRFAIDADLGKALNKSKWTIDSYRLAEAGNGKTHCRYKN
jgi:very-short-patch-repair endonuclease